MPNYKIQFMILCWGILSISTLVCFSVRADSQQKLNLSELTTQRESARMFNQLGVDNLAAGKPRQALERWQQAHQIYTQLQDREGIIGTEINQAQALQSLGLYRQALLTLKSTQLKLQTEPNLSLQARGYLSLGNTLKSLRVLDAKTAHATQGMDWGAKEMLLEALKLAISNQDLALADQVRLSLGNTWELMNDQVENGAKQQAIQQYQAVRDGHGSSLLKVQAQVNLYRLESMKNPDIDTIATVSDIQKKLDVIAPSRATIYAYVNLAKAIQNNQKTELKKQKLLLRVSELLTTSIRQARIIGDKRGEAQAIGSLGSLYQLTEQYADAEKLTKQAIVIAEGLPAPDIAYRLQWQLGRILTVAGAPNIPTAQNAYRLAIGHLQTLRHDLTARDADLQFTFRDSVEPVYREFVDLLLTDEQKILPTDLKTALDLIESLQVAELENYLRQGCLDTYEMPLDKRDRSAAIIYPIVLRHRIVVITSIPDHNLHHSLQFHSYSIPEKEVTRIVDELRDNIRNAEWDNKLEQSFQKNSKQIHDILIAPLTANLQKANIKTLVFILDGPLRNIPMSILYDGKKYLFEKYRLALAPGLKLVLPQNDFERQQHHVLLGGISEARQGFTSLPQVKLELEFIGKLMPNQKLIDAEFNQRKASSTLATDNSSIVHLATHGEFSSDPEKTYILTWDSRLNLNQLNNLLQNRNIQLQKNIDLLVLSACETAAGDSRATLGLAGVAIRARTKSTIASLWSVNDESTQLLMTNFYQNLVTQRLGKAESLRLAQLSLLHHSKYHAPYFWAPFVLIGNW